MITYIILGITMGLTAGLSPGPLLVLLISETVKHNRKSGIKVACVPLITDLPIVLITILVLQIIADYSFVLGTISLLGSVFLAYLAFENIRIKNFDPDIKKPKSNSLGKGIITNFLNPNPYLFWMTIGAPTIVRGYGKNVMLPLLFVMSFYLFLVGSKIIVALLVDRSKVLVKSNVYIIVMRILAVILLLFCLYFIKEGLVYFGFLRK
jgi:threonine/homoserine/homoserine lactone efflux protein